MSTRIKKDYCDYDTCVALKELGYPLTSKEVRYEDKAVFVPGVLLYSAQKWLREEKNIEVNASFDKEDDGWIAFIQRLDYPDLCGTDVFSTVYDTYESALLVSIKEAIEILNKEKSDKIK